MSKVVNAARAIVFVTLALVIVGFVSVVGVTMYMQYESAKQIAKY